MSVLPGGRRLRSETWAAVPEREFLLDWDWDGSQRRPRIVGMRGRRRGCGTKKTGVGTRRKTAGQATGALGTLVMDTGPLPDGNPDADPLDRARHPLVTPRRLLQALRRTLLSNLVVTHLTIRLPWAPVHPDLPSLPFLALRLQVEVRP